MMRGDCMCVAPIMLREGKLCCSRCDRPLVEERDSTTDECSTNRLPIDARSKERFNAACRAGRVSNARKVGRVWVCTRAAWESREGTTPAIPRRPRKTTATPRPVEPNGEAEIMRKLGIVVVGKKAG